MSSVVAWRSLLHPGAGWQRCSRGGSPGAGLRAVRAPVPRRPRAPLCSAALRPNTSAPLGDAAGHVLCCSGKWPRRSSPAARPGVGSQRGGERGCGCAQGWAAGRAGTQRRTAAVRPAAVGAGVPHCGAASPPVPSSRGFYQAPGPPLPFPAPPGSHSRAGCGESGRL